MALIGALERYGRSLEGEETSPIVSSKYDMHELRRTPPSATLPYADEPPVIRILYAFCRRRGDNPIAVILLGGDSSDRPEDWYRSNVARRGTTPRGVRPTGPGTGSHAKEIAAMTTAAKRLPVDSGEFDGELTDEDWERARGAHEDLTAFIKASPRAQARYDSVLAEIDQRQATLRRVRERRALTQATIADLLEMDQSEVSRLERRSDILLSTLRRFISAAGGELHLIASSQRWLLSSFVWSRILLPEEPESNDLNPSTPARGRRREGHGPFDSVEERRIQEQDSRSAKGIGIAEESCSWRSMTVRRWKKVDPSGLRGEPMRIHDGETFTRVAEHRRTDLVPLTRTLDGYGEFGQGHGGRPGGGSSSWRTGWPTSSPKWCRPSSLSRIPVLTRATDGPSRDPSAGSGRERAKPLQSSSAPFRSMAAGARPEELLAAHHRRRCHLGRHPPRPQGDGVGHQEGRRYEDGDGQQGHHRRGHRADARGHEVPGPVGAGDADRDADEQPDRLGRERHGQAPLG